MDNVICRICLQDKLLSFSLFELFNDFDLVDLIYELCNIKITQNDSFPQIICNDCAHKILSAHEIQKLCIESDNYFRMQSDDAEEKSQDVNDENSEGNCDYSECCEEPMNDIIRREDNELVEQYKSTNEEEDLGLETNELLNDHERSNKCKTKCPLCSKMFSHTSNFKRHLNVHREQSPFNCDRCSKSFDSLADLYEHMKVHKSLTKSMSDSFLLNCDICHDASPSYAMFLTHMKTQHQIYDNIKAFKCSVCEMRFTTKQAMRRHIDNIHENNRRNLRNRDKNFLCNTCGKKFLSNFHLGVHIRVHTGEKPFKCEFCDKAFAQMSGLRMHTYTHTGERPFACKICSKSFVQYGHVREHMMTHTNDRPHVCKVCNHAFRVKGNLTAHMLIHSGKKPHGCGMCSKSFFQKTKLKQHTRRVHNGS